MPAQLRKRRGIIGTQAIALAGTGAVLAAMLASPAVAAPGAGHNEARQPNSPERSRPETGRMVTIADTGSAPAAPPQAAPAQPAPAKPAAPLGDLGKPREQSFYGVSGGVDGLRGTIGLSEDGRQLHLGAGIGRPGVSIGAIEKLPDGLNANAKAGVTISKGNKAAVKGKVNLSPDLDVSGSVGVEFSIDLGNGYKLELSGSLAYKDGKWELSTSNGRTVPLDGRRQVTIGDDGKAKMKLPDKPAPWKAKPAVDLDGSLTANGTFDIGKALEALGILDPAPTPSRTPNSVGAPDERAKAPNTSGSPTERSERNSANSAHNGGRAPNSSGSPTDRDERNTANRSPATQSGRDSVSYAGRSPNSSGSPTDRGERNSTTSAGRAPNSSGSPTDRDERSGSSRSTGATNSGRVGPSNGGDRNSASSGGRAPNSSGSPTDRDEHSSTSHTGNTASHHSSSYDGSKNSSGSPDDRDVDNGNTGSGAGCLCS